MDILSGNAYLRHLKSFVPAVFSDRSGPSEKQTLGSLSDGFAGFVPPATIQDRNDLIELAAGKTAALLGVEAARALRESLEESFTAVTANHHAINTLPDFTQGTILYALRLLAGERKNTGRAVPVFAAGGIPMSDFTYPCGVLVGRPRRCNSTGGERLKLFRPQARKTLVSCQSAFEAGDVVQASSQVQSEKWLGFEQAVFRVFFDEVLAAPDVLSQHLYSHQCTVINAQLWSRMFRSDVSAPRLVMLDKLELERDLLIADVQNENSLAHAILFGQELRAAVAQRLNGARGCWACKRLDDRLPPRKGSMFFWGIDRMGRMFSLNLDQEKNSLFSTQYPSFRLELTPNEVERALREGRILPGLYMGFVAIALARGLLCCGGVFQTGYLRHMHKETVTSLAEAGFNVMSACLEMLPDAPLTSGFLPLGFRDGINQPYAAGGIELIASGGLSRETIETLRSMPTAQALGSAFDYIYELAVPPSERLPGWREALRSEYSVELSPNI